MSRNPARPLELPDALRGYRTRHGEDGHYVICNVNLSARLDRYLDTHPVHEILYQWKCYYLVALLIQSGRLILEGENPLWLTIPNSTSCDGLEVYAEWCRKRVDLRLRNKPPGVNRKKMRWQRYTNIFLQCGFKKWSEETVTESSNLEEEPSYAKMGGVSVQLHLAGVNTAREFLTWAPFELVRQLFENQPKWLEESIPRRIRSTDLIICRWPQEIATEEGGDWVMIEDETQTTVTIPVTEEEINSFLREFDF